MKLVLSAVDAGLAAWDACVTGAPFPPSILDATDDHEALLR